MKITKKTKLSEIAKNEKLAEILMEKYGLFCVGCQMAPFETLEEGAKVHGMKDKEIEKMVRRLNEKSKCQSSKSK